MPSGSATPISYLDVVTGKIVDDYTKIPRVMPGYDSFFTQIAKPVKLTNEANRGIARYVSALPITELPLTLGEGTTPLIPSKVFENVYIKNEGMNPTGSFKDRESALVLAYAHQQGYKNLTIASSGNAALSAALYSRIYNIHTTCYIPSRTPSHKTNLIDMFGAHTHTVGDTYEESYHYLMDNLPMGSINITSGALPLRGDGVKTIAYEIWEDLGKVPDVVICPAGNGSALASIYHGFADLVAWGYAKKVPAMISVQIKDADPINQSFKSGKWITVLKNIPDSESEAIVAEESFCSPKAVYAIKKSGGFGISVTDHQVIDGLRFAIDNEGIFPEFSSASAFSALLEHGEKIKEIGKTIVIINTATGLKEARQLRDILNNKD